MVRFALRRLSIIPDIFIQLDPPPLWPTYRDYMQKAVRRHRTRLFLHYRAKTRRPSENAD
jgi:hypothetical protein